MILPQMSLRILSVCLATVCCKFHLDLHNDFKNYFVFYIYLKNESFESKFEW